MKEIRKNWFEKGFVAEADTKVSNKQRWIYLVVSPFIMVGLFLFLTHPGSPAPLFFIPIIVLSLCLKLFALKTLRAKYEKISPKTTENEGLRNMVIILASTILWLFILLAVSVSTL